MKRHQKNAHWLKCRLQTGSVLEECREKVRSIEWETEDREWLMTPAARQAQDLNVTMAELTAASRAGGDGPALL